MDPTQPGKGWIASFPPPRQGQGGRGDAVPAGGGGVGRGATRIPTFPVSKGCDSHIPGAQRLRFPHSRRPSAVHPRLPPHPSAVRGGRFWGFRGRKTPGTPGKPRARVPRAGLSFPLARGCSCSLRPSPCTPTGTPRSSRTHACELSSPRLCTHPCTRTHMALHTRTHMALHTRTRPRTHTYTASHTHAHVVTPTRVLPLASGAPRTPGCATTGARTRVHARTHSICTHAPV